MDQLIFWSILATGVALVVIQGIYAWMDGYLTQKQMRSHGTTNGWSFMEHGGMWADVFPISPLVAYITSYKLEYFSWWGLGLLALSGILTVAAIKGYEKGGLKTPEAHTHDGRTTAAGWIHGLFAMVGLWIFALFYFTPITPSASPRDIVIVSLLLTPFFYLGVVKFSPRWKFEKWVRWQVAGEIVGLWVATTIRILYFT